jgi:hypothetical protein
VLEARGIGLRESALALHALTGLTGAAGEASAQTLRELARRHRLQFVADALNRAR